MIRIEWPWMAIGLFALAGASQRIAAQDPPPPIPQIPETVVEADPPGGGESTSPFDGQYSDPGFGIGAPLGRARDLVGLTDSASTGIFGQSDMEFRPRTRVGEVLELVPGLIATQHSGTGKANQYFVRGFNLDHGTDFALRVDGVPVNLPTHGHGQGYLDVNWLIPELIDYGQYKLGPYYADFGDFSSAGALDLFYVRSLPYGIATATAGQFDYYRVLVANSQALGAGELLYAYESVFYEGPWVTAEDFNKFNGLLRWTLGDDGEGISLNAQAYRGYWNATNQIALRALEAGLVDRFGSLDPTDAGETARVGINAQYWNDNDVATTRANAYVVYYSLDLFSNFTYFLDDPVNGDQIEQIDERVYAGLNLSRQYHGEIEDHTVGFQFRNDSIFTVALNRSRQREFVSNVRDDTVDQQVFSLYYINDAQLTDYLRSMVGLRGDAYRFHTDAHVNPADSGTASAAVFSPKLGLIAGPWYETELFLNWGQSFHSNDARGVTAAVDAAQPLVKSDGSEIGMRSWLTPRWNTTLAAWYLELDSELVFVGDAGTTEPGPASHRFGLTWTNYWRLSEWLTLDCDYAHVRPRFVADQRIPNAVENVLSTGLTVRQPEGPWYGTLRVRHFGPAALIEDNSARSSTTTLVNLQLGYDTQRMRLALDVFNLLDRDDNDVIYFYESQPAGLPAAEDFHFHPVEPRMARVSATWKY
jgi:hypothetical protein